MNTADRSLAMIDYALRRRFAFFELEPAFDSMGFSDHQAETSIKLGNEKFNKLVAAVKSLNEDIAQDATLGAGFRIGHSYFCNPPEAEADVDGWLSSVIEFEIIPLLQEYWFDELFKIDEWAKKLRDAIV
jgi:5-methylcytosine-specific restriction protein B